MIIDTFLFYNELKMLNFRLEYLDPVVDYFVICESTKTFSGKSKELYFEQFKKDYIQTYEKVKNKIIHLIAEDPPLGNSYESNWNRERYQRNYILNGILKINLGINDFILLTDVDEIPDRETLKKIVKIPSFGSILTFVMDMYYYNLECKYINKWYHPKIIPSRFIKKDINLDEIRLSRSPYTTKGGWHFSYFGDTDYIINKLESFSHQEFNNQYYKDKERISKMIQSNQDLFERKEIQYQYIPHLENKYLPEGYEKLISDSNNK
jgi:hypothetical protein